MDPSKSVTEDLICDTGCTSACVVNTTFCRKVGLPITPTNITNAKLGDGSTSLTIRGETIIKTKYLDNPIQIRAVVADEVEGILIGMPGLEQCGIDIISSRGQIHFKNGAVLDYKTGKEVIRTRTIYTPRRATK